MRDGKWVATESAKDLTTDKNNKAYGRKRPYQSFPS